EGRDGVDDDDQTPPRHAIGDVARERSKEHRQPQGEKDQTGCGVTAGEVLGPDTERQDQRAVAEVAERPRRAQPPEGGPPPGAHAADSAAGSTLEAPST